MFASSATGTGSALTSTPSRSIRSPAASFRNCPRTPLICSCAPLLIVICSSGHDPRHRVPPPASASVSASTRFASHHLPICPSFRFCFRGHQLSRLSSDRRPADVCTFRRVHRLRVCAFTSPPSSSCSATSFRHYRPPPPACSPCLFATLVVIFILPASATTAPALSDCCRRSAVDIVIVIVFRHQLRPVSAAIASPLDCRVNANPAQQGE